MPQESHSDHSPQEDQSVTTSDSGVEDGRVGGLVVDVVLVVVVAVLIVVFAVVVVVFIFVVVKCFVHMHVRAGTGRYQFQRI